MLAYILAIAVGLGSIALYLAAFVYPEVHRKEDFYLSALGFFYALVLWVCAGRITGGVLLGQLAGVSLLGWFAWQSVGLRRAIAHPGESVEIYPQIQAKLAEILQAEWIAGLIAPVANLFRKSEEPQIESTLSPENFETKPVAGVVETTEDLNAKTEEEPLVTEPSAQTAPVEETEQTIHTPEVAEQDYLLTTTEQLDTEAELDLPPEETASPTPEEQPVTGERPDEENLSDFSQEYETTIEFTPEEELSAKRQTSFEELLGFEGYKTSGSQTAKSDTSITEEEEVEEIDDFLFGEQPEQKESSTSETPTSSERSASEESSQTQSESQETPKKKPKDFFDFDL